MCGLCLPHCPTYNKTQNEAESPRGRISLIMALANKHLEPDAKLQEHLDNCLLCRACEAKCPSGVPYGEIMDGARAALAQDKPKKEQRIPLDQLAIDKKKQRSEATKLWLANKTGLRTLGRALGIPKAMGLERFEQLAPNIKRPHDWQEYYPAKSEKRGDVGLFIGCFSDMFDQQTLDDAIIVLNRLGYGVHVPNTQTCCGAIHQHEGDKEKALQLAQQNIHAFTTQELDAVISCATGCGSHIKDYSRIANSSLPIQDINTFICQHLEAHPDTTFKTSNQRVAVHESCTMRNVLKESHSLYALLAYIPELEVIALPGNEQCCGAAGSYMIEHPEMADSLRNDKLQAVADVQPDILVTANIGCALHIAAGLRKENPKVQVLHPISLLAKQLI